MTLHPNWPEIYRGETITLKCEIEDGGDNEWEYEWSGSNSQTAEKQKEYMIKHAVSSDSGDYRCLGKLKGETSSTKWSDVFKLKVSGGKSCQDFYFAKIKSKCYKTVNI